MRPRQLEWNEMEKGRNAHRGTRRKPFLLEAKRNGERAKTELLSAVYE